MCLYVGSTACESPLGRSAAYDCALCERPVESNQTADCRTALPQLVDALPVKACANAEETFELRACNIATYNTQMTALGWMILRLML